MSNFLETLRRERIVVVIRGAAPATLTQELRALYEGGLRIFEVTMEAEGALSALQSVRASLPSDALLGAGTVLDGASAVLAMNAGARFIVSPILLEEVCSVVRARGLPCVLGAMTPTEVHSAYRMGCEVVKIFPASTLGSGFLHELQGPLGFIPLYPTGGITLENAGAFLDTGAIAVGVGSALMKKDWVQNSNWEALRQAATHWAKLKSASYNS
ncbi:MAG TPA: bifunctional 4-hydroxy-2-oxoglutarate aldolase/2-dehydro-3-deoxy-phosphogluconate aldolase [Ktedonobacteraceae bacterium]|nr:bifunctional 4-hydroxy-2-oxoglutarate aldolase/2-dehydro-3-deoxy-phosphogluconate aldolase [Ktedonobacteraceae bacterium]